MKAPRILLSFLVSLILTSTALFVYTRTSHPPVIRTPAGFAIPTGHLTVWNDSGRSAVGVLDPVLYTSPIPESPSILLKHIAVSPHLAWHVSALSAHRFWIQPDVGWPAHREIRVTVTPYGIASTTIEFTTDANKSVTVNLTHQRVLAYKNGHLIRSMPTSTGVAPDWTTPTGTFWIYKKVPDDHMKGGIAGTPDSWDVQHVPWAQYIYGGIAIHGAWWNRRLGIPRSHGCIQLATATHNLGPQTSTDDAKWLYHFTDMGTPVIVVGTTPPTATRPLQYPRQVPPKRAPTSAKSDASLNP